MSEKKGDADAKRAAANDARRHGKSASEVGASTGSSKQIDTSRTKDRTPKGDAKS